MDISDITKFANKKGLATDAEKLREKVTKERENIIKLKVIVPFICEFPLPKQLYENH